MTTVADGLFQYGGMPVTGGVPPFVSRNSKAFFVDAVNGSDGNDGTAPGRAFKSLYRAHYMMTSGNNDVCYLIGNGAASGSVRLSVANAIAAQGASETPATTGTLTWSKSACHLIGVAAPGSNARARIATPTGTYTQATFNALPFITVSGSGNYFANLATFQQFSTGADGEINFNVTGSYNIFNNVLMGGMASALAAAGAASRVLKIATGGENTFLNCQIGLDTVTRSAANANLEFASGTARNRFVGCVFPVMTSSATALGILGTGAACMDRFQLFTDCWFINAVKSTSTGMTAIASMTSASPGGMLVFANCNSVGATKWGDTNALANSYVSNVGGAATDGLMLAPT